MEIIDADLCCGCEACANICPKKCIEMIENEEGFLVPRIDDRVCVSCGCCREVCPVILRVVK